MSCRAHCALLFLFSLLFLASATALHAADGDADKTAITVTPLGLRIVAPLPEGVKQDDKLCPFNMESRTGTTIALLISSPSGDLVHFDHKNSALARFTDGKGNDLLAQPNKGARDYGTTGFSLFPKLSSDGKACLIEASGPSVPAKGAGSIRLEGTLTMLCATEKKEFVLKDIALAKGTKLSAEKTELTIESAGKPAWGDEPLALTLRSHNTELDEVAEIKFFNAAGKEIAARRTGSSKMGILGSMTVDWDYVLSEKAATATVKIYLWADLRKKIVPFALTVDAGL